MKIVFIFSEVGHKPEIVKKSAKTYILKISLTSICFKRKYFGIKSVTSLLLFRHTKKMDYITRERLPCTIVWGEPRISGVTTLVILRAKWLKNYERFRCRLVPNPRSTQTLHHSDCKQEKARRNWTLIAAVVNLGLKCLVPLWNGWESAVLKYTILYHTILWKEAGLSKVTIIGKY